MSLRRFVPTNRNAEADQSSLENARTTTFTSNVTTVPTHNLSGRDPVETASSLMDSLGVADPNYGEHPSGNFKFSPLLLICNSVSILPDLC